MSSDILPTMTTTGGDSCASMNNLSQNPVSEWSDVIMNIFLLELFIFHHMYNELICYRKSSISLITVSNMYNVGFNDRH